MGTRFKIGCDWKSFSVGSIDEVVVAVVVVAVVGVLGLGLVLMLADEVLLENNFKLVELWQNERCRRLGEHALKLTKWGWDALNILGDVTMTLLNILLCLKNQVIVSLIAGNIFFFFFFVF